MYCITCTNIWTPVNFRLVPLQNAIDVVNLCTVHVSYCCMVKTTQNNKKIVTQRHLEIYLLVVDLLEVARNSSSHLPCFTF